MKLRRWLQEYWGLDYDRLNNQPFDNSGTDYFQARDFEFNSQGSILSMLVEKGMVKSKSEAKRALASGAIRVGLGDEWTSFKSCQKLKTDRPLEPNDLIRLGKRAFRMVPKRPSFWAELSYSLNIFAEEAGRICNIPKKRAGRAFFDLLPQTTGNN